VFYHDIRWWWFGYGLLCAAVVSFGVLCGRKRWLPCSACVVDNQDNHTVECYSTVIITIVNILYTVVDFMWFFITVE
jgi:hypothetical protein